jgi:hypothetical protein
VSSSHRHDEHHDHGTSRRDLLGAAGAIAAVAFGAPRTVGAAPVVSPNAGGPWNGGTVPASFRSSRRMSDATLAFLKSLNTAQRTKAFFARLDQQPGLSQDDGRDPRRRRLAAARRRQCLVRSCQLLHERIRRAELGTMGVDADGSRNRCRTKAVTSTRSRAIRRTITAWTGWACIIKRRRGSRAAPVVRPVPAAHRLPAAHELNAVHRAISGHDQHGVATNAEEPTLRAALS